MTTTKDALQAVKDASAALTLAIGHRDPRLGAIEPELRALQQTVARVQTLLVMHPDLALDEDLPAGAMPPEEEMQRIATIAALEMATAMPSGPVTVKLQVPLLCDGSEEDSLRQWINDRCLTAQPDGWGYVLDMTEFVSFLADTLTRPEEDIISPSETRKMTPARQKLLKAFGPRKEDS